MSLLILVVDDEPDVEALFRQQFRRDIRDGRFTMDFAQSADGALNCVKDGGTNARSSRACARGTQNRGWERDC